MASNFRQCVGKIVLLLLFFNQVNSKLIQSSRTGLRSLQSTACIDDVQECPDGSFVSRDPDNNCEFEACPASVVCAADVQECPDGSFVSRDPDNNCEFEPCPLSTECEVEEKLCPDGVSITSRSLANNCEFSPCDVVCALDVRECPSGEYVSRDPENGCEFSSCPEEDEAEEVSVSIDEESSVSTDEESSASGKTSSFIGIVIPVLVFLKTFF